MTDRPTGRYCKSCRYDLRVTTEPKCPECGQAFNPDDPTSYLKHPGLKLSKFLLITESITVLSLLAVMAAPWLYYVVSCMEDGAWPKPAYNTPEGTNNLFIALPVVVLVFFLKTPILIGSVGVFIGSFLVRVNQEHTTGRSFLLCLAIPVFWCLVVLDQVSDIWNIWYWIYD